MNLLVQNSVRWYERSRNWGEMMYNSSVQNCKQSVHFSCANVKTNCMHYTLFIQYTIINQLEMWANAQRDSRPAEYRWRPLFNAAMFGWCPILDCCAVKLPRRETHWNLLGCPKLPDWSQPLVGRSSPYYQDMWRRYCCLTSFSPIVDTCLSCEDIARQSCTMVRRWRLFGILCVLHFQQAACSTFQTCILNSH